MANTITKQTLVNDARNLVVKVHILGDNSGDEAATNIVDVSALDANIDRVKITRIQSSLEGFSANLIWDATANVDIITLPQSDMDQDYSSFGGLVNNSTTGRTGDILIDTVGLGAEEGTIILHMKKRIIR
jgi:hypothetical protein